MCCVCAPQPNVGRYTTGLWTRAYLEQQLHLMLAGRAAEELVFGRDELSSLHQAKIMLAREVRGCKEEGGEERGGGVHSGCQKWVVAAAVRALLSHLTPWCRALSLEPRVLLVSLGHEALRGGL